MITPTLKMRTLRPAEKSGGSCMLATAGPALLWTALLLSVHCLVLEATSPLFWMAAFRETPRSQSLQYTPFLLSESVHTTSRAPPRKLGLHPVLTARSQVASWALAPFTHPSLSLTCSIQFIATSLQPKCRHQCRPVAPSPGWHSCSSNSSSIPQPECTSQDARLTWTLPFHGTNGFPWLSGWRKAPAAHGLPRPFPVWPYSHSSPHSHCWPQTLKLQSSLVPHSSACTDPSPSTSLLLPSTPSWAHNCSNCSTRTHPNWVKGASPGLPRPLAHPIKAPVVLYRNCSLLACFCRQASLLRVGIMSYWSSCPVPWERLVGANPFPTPYPSAPHPFSSAEPSVLQERSAASCQCLQPKPPRVPLQWD